MTQTAKYYGDALYELARDEHLDTSILEQMTAVSTAFRTEPDYLKLLASPSISKQERCRVLKSDFAALLQPYLLNFLMLLTERGAIREYFGCCEEYRKRYNQDHGILEVKALTAIPLSEALTRKLTAKLSAVTGKTIALSNYVDDSVLGGVRLEMDGTQLDGTIRRKLDEIRENLNSTVL